MRVCIGATKLMFIGNLPCLPAPVAHKQLFLQEGVVDAALDALRQSTFAHIQFKALAILRLLVDQQGE